MDGLLRHMSRLIQMGYRRFIYQERNAVAPFTGNISLQSKKQRPKSVATPMTAKSRR